MFLPTNYPSYTLIFSWFLLQFGTVLHAAELDGAVEISSTSSIKGQISGALDVSGLSVILESSSLLMESSVDALGQFSFEALPTGKYVIKLSGSGYDLGSAQNVSLAENESASLDFEISPLSSDGFLFEWKDDASSGGTEISSHINKPLEVTLLGAVESIGEGNYHQYLWNEFSILLSGKSIKWNQEHAYRLLETLHQLLDDFMAQGLMPSVWELSSDEIENDVTVEQVGEEMRVVLSNRVFTHASPLIAEVEGKRGTYFSKRLHHACLHFLAVGEMGRSRLERVLENRFDLKVSGLDYTSLTQWTTTETADRFQSFHMEELIQIINTFEEMPEGFHKIPNLKYLARRQTGMDHPLYPSAPAVAWTSLEDGYIEFVDTAFTSTSTEYLHRLIIHEKAHFIYGVLLSDALIETWHEVGGWYENPEDPQGWSTTKTTEFVSAYAHGKNPNEDFAESVSYFVIDPDKLRSRSLPKYEFIRDYIMQGSVYLSQTREDLTFEVLNLYPDYYYPGKIKRLHVDIGGAPEKDKELVLTVELQTLEGVLDGASRGHLRIASSIGTYEDLYLDPIDDEGFAVGSSHTLQGKMTFSKYAKSGFWFTDQISIYDEVGNERHSGVDDFGWKLFLNNPLEDFEAPQYIEDSLEMMIETAVVEGQTMQRLKVQWKITENRMMASHDNCYVSLLPPGNEAYRLEQHGYGIDDGNDGFDSLQNVCRVDFLIPNFYRSGDYTVQQIRIRDEAGNEQSVYFSDHPGDQAPISQTILTATPDMESPELDLNKLSLTATPSNPDAPNGETFVDIGYWVRDDISGLGKVSFRLRDPQGIEHHNYHYHDNYYGLNFDGDPTAWQGYEANVVLPIGSTPGIWGLAELYLQDKANNFVIYDFTETIRFDLDGNEMTNVPDGGKPIGGQLLFDMDDDEATIISDDITNEAPNISTMEDLEISEGAAQVSVDFSVTDTDSSFDEITVQASTSNPFLISALAVEGRAGEQDVSQWTLNFTTVADQFGEDTITVEINDGYQSISTSFNVTVSAVNNAPKINGVPYMIEAEGRKVVVPFQVSDDQTSAGNLFIYLTAQPLDYILKGHVLVLGNGAQRELILNNSGNAEGTGQFSVVVTDADGKTATQAFEVNFGGKPPVAVVPELKLNTSDPSNLTLSWEGDAQLLFTEDLSANFEAVAGATSPYTIEQESMGFYILRVEP